MKNLTFTQVSAILVTMALSVLFNACSKSGPEGGGSTDPVSGGGGGDASLQLKMECTFENPVCYRLVATTAKSIAKYDKFFEIDTNPNPRVRHDCEQNYDRSFTSGFLGVLPVSEGKIYCRAVVANGKDTTRSEVVSFDAVAGFPFLESVEGVVHGGTIMVRGRFRMENFDFSKLGKMGARGFCPSVPTEKSYLSEFDGNEDGRFVGAVGCPGPENLNRDCIVHVQYTYDGLTYVHPFELKKHINGVDFWGDNIHHFFDSKLEKYMLETYGSDGKITSDQAWDVKCIDIKGLGVETVDDISCCGYRAQYMYFDNNPIEYIELDCSNLLRVLTCSDCKNLTRIDLRIGSGETVQLSRLDVHGCTKLKTIGARRSSNMHVDTLICYSCNFTELPTRGLVTDCHDNKLESLYWFYGKINCSHNVLKNVTLDQYVTDIDCSYNLLEELDISMCEELERLDCSHNELLATVYVNAAQMENPGFIVKDEHTQLVLKQ